MKLWLALALGLEAAAPKALPVKAAPAARIAPVLSAAPRLSAASPAAPSLAALPAPALAAVPTPAAPAPEASAVQPTLLQTLSLPAARLAEAPAGEAAAAAEADFMARAQLAAPAKTPAAAVSGAPSTKVVPLAKPSARAAAAPRAQPASGLTMAEGLKRLSQGETKAALARPPTPEDLRQLADLKHFEALLTRDRATQEWTLWRGDRFNVSSDDGDFDRAYHNHIAMRIGLNALYSPYPSPEDLSIASTMNGRFMVVSEHGVVEWNGDTGGAHERLENTFIGRVVMRLLFPAFYENLLAHLGVAAELRPWKKVTQDWLDNGRPPENARLFAKRMSWIPADEHAKVAARMGGAHIEPDVEFYIEKPGDRWFERWNGTPGVPDGVCWRDSKLIQLFVRRHWRKLKDPETHYRVLFTHEFAHRLQFEGLWNMKYGVEIPAVAVELLRAVELVGLDELRAGRVDFIHAGVLGGFDSGVQWARSGRADAAAFFYKGALAGAAWELARRTGRPGDAWEFVRRVSSAANPEDPRTVYDSIMDAVKLEGSSADLR